jgi:hypothetical protein
MKQLNNEQRTIVNDILYKKTKNSTKPFYIFLARGVGTRKPFFSTCIIQNMLQYYINQITNVGLLKPKVMKLTYIGKIEFNINGQQYIPYL